MQISPIRHQIVGEYRFSNWTNNDIGNAEKWTNDK